MEEFLGPMGISQYRLQKFWGHNRNSGDKFWGHNTKFFKDELQEKKYQELRQHERTGRPLGSDLRTDKLEVLRETTPE